MEILIRAQGEIWAVPYYLSSEPEQHFCLQFWEIATFKAYLARHKFDIVCLSETYLNSRFSFDDDNLDIPGYIMVRANHPANSKHGGVWMHYKNCLPLKILGIRFLHESIALDLWPGDKLRSFISLYRSHLTNHMLILYLF